jgi:hypothetical protein
VLVTGLERRPDRAFIDLLTAVGKFFAAVTWVVLSAAFQVPVSNITPPRAR